MKNLIFFSMAVILFCGCGQNKTSSEPPQAQQSLSAGQDNNYIKEGVAYLNKGDVASAIHNFNKAIVQNPRDAKPYMILAEVYMRLQNYKNAIENLNHVVVLEPDNGPAYYFLGICYGLNGNKKEAIKSLERSVFIFQQIKDEENFKKAVTILQQMTESQTADQN